MNDPTIINMVIGGIAGYQLASWVWSLIEWWMNRYKREAFKVYFRTYRKFAYLVLEGSKGPTTVSREGLWYRDTGNGECFVCDEIGTPFKLEPYADGYVRVTTDAGTHTVAKEIIEKCEFYLGNPLLTKQEGGKVNA